MSRLQVFPDTGVMLAMIVFPRDRDGNPTLAGEVLELYEAGAFDLVVSRVVVDELEEVIDRDFPEARSQVVQLLAPLTDGLTRRPTPEEVDAALPFTTDPEDAPIFAAAVEAGPDIVLSNDFNAFHTPQAKQFWKDHNMVVESLYGLLCVFGRRERKETEYE
ncbi:MAG: PIN domain-containing protein [Anaerolineae bacterium]